MTKYFLDLSLPSYCHPIWKMKNISYMSAENEVAASAAEMEFKMLSAGKLWIELEVDKKTSLIRSRNIVDDSIPLYETPSDDQGENSPAPPPYFLRDVQPCYCLQGSDLSDT